MKCLGPLLLLGALSACDDADYVALIPLTDQPEDPTLGRWLVVEAESTVATHVRLHTNKSTVATLAAPSVRETVLCIALLDGELSTSVVAYPDGEAVVTAELVGTEVSGSGSSTVDCNSLAPNGPSFVLIVAGAPETSAAAGTGGAGAAASGGAGGKGGAQ